MRSGNARGRFIPRGISVSFSAMIRIRGVTRIYSGGETPVRALDNVSLDIGPGEFASVTGPSGCGKSTLLNLIGGLDKPDEGEIFVDDVPLHSAGDAELTAYRRHKLGIVFQFFNLLPSMTVEENVALPLLLRGERPDAVKEQTAKALEMAEISGRARHFPGQLSGGEMQRAAIARAIAGSPRVLLADEPTGNLDSKNAARVTETLLKIASQETTALIIVTHSEALAEKAPRRIHMLDGKIIQTRTP